MTVRTRGLAAARRGYIYQDLTTAYFFAIGLVDREMYYSVAWRTARGLDCSTFTEGETLVKLKENIKYAPTGRLIQEALPLKGRT